MGELLLNVIEALLGMMKTVIILDALNCKLKMVKMVHFLRHLTMILTT